MIERIKGLIEKKGSSSVILAVNGIGLEINMSINALESLPSIGKEIQILTFLNVREDLLELYGFVNRLERQSFLLLISISGIGPKLALTILSGISTNNLKESIIAATVLKIQEKKNQKGLSYAIVKFTDLGGVFELFVFSDLFEKKRDVLKEGNSVFMNLIKNISPDGTSSRVNVRTITKISDLTNSPIKSIEIDSLNINDLSQIKGIISTPGETNVILNILNNNTFRKYKLNEKRKVDQNTILKLKNAGVTLKIY